MDTRRVGDWVHGDPIPPSIDEEVVEVPGWADSPSSRGARRWRRSSGSATRWIGS